MLVNAQNHLQHKCSCETTSNSVLVSRSINMIKKKKIGVLLFIFSFGFLEPSAGTTVQNWKLRSLPTVHYFPCTKFCTVQKYQDRFIYVPCNVFVGEACQAGRRGQLEAGPPHLKETSFKAAVGVCSGIDAAEGRSATPQVPESFEKDEKKKQLKRCVVSLLFYTHKDRDFNPLAGFARRSSTDGNMSQMFRKSVVVHSAALSWRFGIDNTLHSCRVDQQRLGVCACVCARLKSLQCYVSVVRPLSGVHDGANGWTFRDANSSQKSAARQLRRLLHIVPLDSLSRVSPWISRGGVERFTAPKGCLWTQGCRERSSPCWLASLRAMCVCQRPAVSPQGRLWNVCTHARTHAHTQWRC